MDAETEALLAEYARLLHAMQSGVAFDHGAGGQDGTPKHLRVGVNAAMSDHGALVKLLVDKGVISGREYAQAIVDGMRAEVERYRSRIAAQHGCDPSKITFA